MATFLPRDQAAAFRAANLRATIMDDFEQELNALLPPERKPAPTNNVADFEALDRALGAGTPVSSPTVESPAVRPETTPVPPSAQTYPDPVAGGSTPVAVQAQPEGLTSSPSGSAPPATAPRPAGDLVTNQFQAGLSYDEAMAACGPVAAQALARAYGNDIPLDKVMEAARRSGWNTAGGMNGVTNQKRMLDQLGIPSRLDMAPDWGSIARDASSGNPVIISTPKHYYVAQGFDPGTGKFFVGESGKVFKQGGGAWMSAAEIAAQGGGINGALFADAPTSPTPSVAKAAEPSSPFDIVASFSGAVGAIGSAVGEGFDRAGTGARAIADTAGNIAGAIGEARDAGIANSPIAQASDAYTAMTPEPSTGPISRVLDAGVKALTSEEGSLRDPRIQPIVDKVARREPLTPEEEHIFANYTINVGGMTGAVGPVAKAGTAMVKAGGEVVDDLMQAGSQRLSDVTGLPKRSTSLLPEPAPRAPVPGAAADMAPVPGVPPTIADVAPPAAPPPPEPPAATKLPSGVTPPDESLQPLYEMQARNAARRGPDVGEFFRNLPRTLERKLTDDYVELNRIGRGSEVAVANYRARGEALKQRMERDVAPVLDLAKSPQEVADLNVLVRLQRDIEVGTINPGHQFSGGTTSVADAQAKLAKLEATVGPERWAKLRQADTLRQQALDKLLDDKVAAGMVPQEVADAVRASQPHYNPTKLDELVAEGAFKGFGGSGKRMTVNSNGMRKLREGTESDTEDPIASFVRAIGEGELAIQKNRVAQQLVKDLRASPEYKDEVRRLPNVQLTTGAATGPDAVPGSKATVANRRPPLDVDGAISVFEKGERQLWTLPESNPLIEKAVKNLDPQPLSAVQRTAAAMNALPRAAFTQFSPYFVVKNAATDVLALYLRHGLKGLTNLPEGIANAAFQTPAFKKALREGGGGAHFSSGETPEELIRKIRASGGHPINSIKDPYQLLLDLVAAESAAIGTAVSLDPSDPNYLQEVAKSALMFGAGRRVIGKAAQIGEQGVRFAGYKTAVQKGASATEAATEFRRSTIDFSRMGEWVRAWNPVSMFLGARVGGGLQIPRTLREVPEAKFRLAGITAATVGIYALNRDHPEYYDVPDAIRQTHLVAMLPWSTKEKPAYVAPALREMGVFAAPVIYALDQWAGKDEKGLGEFLANYANAFIPGAPGGDASTAALGVIPQLPRSIAEVAFNRNAFTGTPITPQSLQDVTAAERYTDRTSELAKALGKRFNMAPTEIDHYIRANLGGAGRALQERTNTLQGRPSEGTGIAIVDQFLGGLIRQGGGQKRSDQYDKLNELSSMLGPIVADMVRQSPQYQRMPRDEQLRQLRSAQAELDKNIKETLGIESTPKELGLPPKYIGVDDPAREKQIDRAVSKVEAWRRDPRTVARPTGEELQLSAQYSGRVNPAYRRETEARQKDVNKADVPIQELVRARAPIPTGSNRAPIP